MDVTWFELRPVAIEIGTKLRGYYVNNVYRSGPRAITLRLRNPEGRESLLLVHVRRALWIAGSAPRLQRMDDALRKLRDLLLRLRISGASAVRNERIVEVDADPGRRIYFEFFGTGNVVVTSGDTVEAALNVVEGRERRIVPGEPYSLPPARRSIFEASGEELAGALRPGRPLSRSLGSAFLAPSKYLEEAIWRAGLDPSAPADSVGREDLRRLEEELSSLFSELTSGTALYTYRGEGFLEVAAARLRRLEEALGLEPKLHESPSEALDEALRAEVLEEERAREDAGRLDEEARAHEARAREIAARATTIRELAAKVAAGELGPRDAARSLGGDAEVRGGLLLLGDLRAPLDNPHAVSSAMYDYAKRLERAASALLARATELRERAARLEPGPAAAGVEELVARERKWYEGHRWFYTSGALLAVGGRDAAGNSAIIRRHLDGGDLVFHAEIVGSPFFVLKGGRGAASERDLREVATATVSFSRAWREGLAAADAYYVYPEQVSLSAPSGEYLPRGSFMIRGSRNYLRGLRLEIAVGFCADPAEGRIVLCSGPRTAIDERGIVYVVLEPGHVKASDVASKIARMLADHLPPGQESLRGLLSVDAVMRLLPPGNSRVVEIARGKRLREEDPATGLGV
ncbi:MAG: NFACT RNA binding domain-containing protein [Conexivisphaera sp.]